jgi:glycosyltransferase involved in cell wall biosynthesis
MKKNVLQFIGSFHQGGSERQAVQLARLMQEDETFNVLVATLNKEGVLLNELEEMGFTQIPEFRLTSFFNLDFLKQIRACAEFLRENKIEIVHTHDFYTNIFGILAARYAKIPVKIASKRETGGMRSENQNRIEKFVFKIADKITVNAEAVKVYLVEKDISADKIKIIYNGLDLERLQPKEKNRGKICGILDLPKEENIKFITIVANLRHEVKNQELLLCAAKRLKVNFPNAHFVFAGEGKRKTELENIAEELDIKNNTHFIGRCDIIPELLSISYACVLTSTAEGFSNSILEYMSAAKPVVTTNVGGAGEAIIDGETGYLIESGDVEGLEKCLAELLENPETANEMGKKAKKIVEEKFSTETQLKNLVNFYQSCINEKGK